MRETIRKVVAIVAAVCLIYPNASFNCLAKDYSVSENRITDDIQVDILKDIEISSEYEKNDSELSLQSAENDIALIAEETQETENTSQDEGSTIYYGSLSGKLSQTNDYVLYPVQLSAGEYFQAKLTMPDDSQIDYDLILFDLNLSLIKSSDYVTCTTSTNSTLEESIGYLASEAEKIYACVYSVAGGSDTEEYILDYAITTNFTDSTEPNENVKEAAPLTLGVTGATITGTVSCPIDNDWYSLSDGTLWEAQTAL